MVIFSRSQRLNQQNTSDIYQTEIIMVNSSVREKDKQTSCGGIWQDCRFVWKLNHFLKGGGKFRYDIMLEKQGKIQLWYYAEKHQTFPTSKSKLFIPRNITKLYIIFMKFLIVYLFNTLFTNMYLFLWLIRIWRTK